MTYTNGYNRVQLLKLSEDYAVSCRHGNSEVTVKVDAETVRNMARHVEHEENRG
jgi:hypothetical protein